MRHWPPNVPDIVWGPLAAATLIVVVGALGIATNQPLLFPSLGPTAFLQVEDPELRVARLYNTVVGHIVGIFAGLISVFLLHLSHAPSPMVTGILTTDRILASTFAVALTIALGLLLRASHPPACATTLLIALGGFAPTLQVVLIVLAGVVLIGVIGEFFRRYRLGKVKKLPI